MDAQVVVVLDGMRKQRNLAGYTGEPIPESTVEECLRPAELLLAVAVDWLARNRKQLR